MNLDELNKKFNPRPQLTPGQWEALIRLGLRRQQTHIERAETVNIGPNE